MSVPWTTVMSVTPEVTDICNKVRNTIEAKAGTKYKVYIPLSFASQILEVGTEYVVKVEVGPDECVHAMISVTVAGTTVTRTVLRIQHPKTVADPLVPF